jgi:hypothetical protein
LAFAKYILKERRKGVKKRSVTGATRFVSLPFDEKKPLDQKKGEGKHGGIGLRADGEDQNGNRAEGQ